MALEQLTKIVYKTLTGFMAIWLSGVVLLFCCEKMNGGQNEVESCPMAKMSAHCDKAAKADPNPAIFERDGADCVDCYGFFPAIFDKSRKVEPAQKQIALAPWQAAVKFTFRPVAVVSPLTTAFHTRVPDRHDIFIKNCVFRI